MLLPLSIASVAQSHAFRCGVDGDTLGVCAFLKELSRLTNYLLDREQLAVDFACQSRSNQQLRDRPKQYGHNCGSRDAERDHSQPFAPRPYRGIAIGWVSKKSRPTHGDARDNFRPSVSGGRLVYCETLLAPS